MKTMLLAILILGSATAFAAPQYSCFNLETKDLNSEIRIEIAQDGRSVLLLQGSPVEQVTRDESLPAPAGFVGFSGVGGCPDAGPFRCYARVLVDLMVSHELMEGAMQGDVIYNDQTLRCGMLLK